MRRRNASRPSLDCKPSSVFKAKRNKHSVSQPKPQQHKRCSCQQELLAKCKLAALQFRVQQQACHAVWRSGKPQSSSKPRFTNGRGLFFVAFTISLSNSYNSPLFFFSSRLQTGRAIAPTGTAQFMGNNKTPHAFP